MVVSLRTHSLLVALLSLLATACTPPATEGDAGSKPTADAGGGALDAGAGDDAGTPADDGGTDAGDGGDTEPPVDYPNETCATAQALTPGTTVEASTAGGGNDHEGGCGSSATGPEVVYALQLSEDSGLVVEAEGYDIVLRLAQGGCEATDEIEGGCVDDSGALSAERLEYPLLPAGQYYIIVDSYFTEGGDFSLDVEVFPGGYCAGDAFDPDDATAQGAVFAGSDDIDTRDLDPSTPEPEAVDLVLCEGDADWFLFGHMGGDVTLDVAQLMGAGAVTAEVYEATVTPDDLGGVTITEGMKLLDAPIDPAAELARGYYLVKVTGTGQAGLGDSYAVAVTHECRPDLADDPLVDFDDTELSRAGLTLHDRPGAPIERSLCGDDTDSVVLESRYGGDVTLTLGGGAAINVDVGLIVEMDGAETVQPYGGTVDGQTSGDDLVVRIPGVPAGTRFFVTVSLDAGAPLDPMPYTLDARFGDPPANEACDAAQALTAAPDAVAVPGSTLNGTSESAGPCNGDLEAAELGRPGAADVFYTFSLAQNLDTDITFDGALDPDDPSYDFEGSVYLYVYPGTCPASLGDLALFSVTDADGMETPVCQAGEEFRVRIPQMPAGDYLLVVDGRYEPATSFSSEAWTSGRFELNVQSYPDGFPPPVACQEATVQALPSPGGTVSFDVDTTVGINELEAADYGCLDYGARGKERVVELTPEQDLTVTIGTSVGFDTMLTLREGTCAAGTDLACDDDSGVEGSNSLLEGVQLTGGTTYYLFVEGYFADSEGTTTVTITAQ